MAEGFDSQTRVIVLNYPSNPTGAYPTLYLQGLQDFAEVHDLWIVSDEVYGSLYYRPISAAAFDEAKTNFACQQSFQILCDDGLAVGPGRRG